MTRALCCRAAPRRAAPRLEIEIERVDSLADARARLLQNPPDACLLSYGRDADDAELWRELRRREVPFIVLVEEQSEVESAVTQSGASDGLALQGLSAPWLQSAIRYAVERQKLKSELARQQDWHQQDSHQQQPSPKPSPIHAHLLDVIGQAVVVTDLDGRITYWNVCAQEVYGWNSSEVIGRPIRDVTPNNATRAQNEEMRARIANNRKWEGEVLAQKRDGSHFSVTLSQTPVVDDAGQVVSIVALSIDISARKQAEEKLRRSEASLAKAQEIAGLGSWEVDLLDLDDHVGNLLRSGHPLRWSDQVFRMFGSQPGQVEVSKENFFAAVHPDDRAGMLEAVDEAVRSSQGFTLEHRIVLPDGSERRVRQQAAIVLDEASGKALRMLGTVQDITEQKQAEDRLRQSNDRLSQSNELLRAVMQDTPNAIFAKDTAGRYLMINAAGAGVLGRDMDKILGRTDAELVAPEVAQVWMENDRRIMEQGVVQVQDEVAEVDGATRTYLATKAPLRGPNGDVVGLVGIPRDISERKLAELQQEAATQQIVATWESMTDAFFSVDGDWIFTYVNAQAARMWGRKIEDLLGETLWEMFPALLGTEFEVGYRRATRKGVTLSFEAFYEPHQAWREVHAYPSPLGLSVYFRDTTERRAASGAMKRLAAIVESSNDAIIGRTLEGIVSLDMLGIAGLDGHFKRLNPAFSQTLGYTDAELMAQPFLSFVHPDDRAATEAVFQNMSQGDALIAFENRYRAKDGSYRWMEWKGAVALEQSSIYAAARDVTARHENEASLLQMRDDLEVRVEERTSQLEGVNAELQRQKTVLEAQGEASADGIVVVSEAGEVVFSNRRFAEMWGFPAALVEARSDARLLDFVLDQLEDPQGFIDRVSYLYEHQEENSREELALKDGRTFDRYGAAARGADGTHYGWVWFFHDMTERKLAEVLIREAKEEAERANQAKSGFLSRMSHELRTPLNAILGFGQILEMHAEKHGEEDQDSITQILKAGRHLLSLINQVLDIARIEAGYLSLSLEPTPAGDVVQEALDLVRPLAAARGIELENGVIGDDAGRHLLADQQRLKQVLLNLLSNAVKYNREGGGVFVSCEITESAPVLREGIRHEGTLRFLVRDTGAGLSPEDLSKLFVSFERLGAARTQIEGTGIGLTLSKRLVEAMNGQIGVQSEVGAGSTFWIELPLVASPLEHDAHGQEGEAGQEAARVAPTLGGVKTILYIEDNLSNIKLIERALSEQNYRIKLLTAMQGSVGLELAALHAPDLILLDMHLPDLTGDVVLSRLRSDAATQKIPVIVLSADATPSRAERIVASGAQAYLTKPLDLRRFFHVVEEAVSKTG